MASPVQQTALSLADIPRVGALELSPFDGTTIPTPGAGYAVLYADSTNGGSVSAKTQTGGAVTQLTPARTLAALSASGAQQALDAITIGPSTDVTITVRIKGGDGNGNRANVTLVGGYSRNGSASAVQKFTAHGTPWVLDTSYWAPTLDLSGNVVTVHMFADLLQSTQFIVERYVEVTDTSGIPAPVSDPLASVKSLVLANGGWLLTSLNGAIVDGGKPGYCNHWVDLSGNGWTWTAPASAQDPQIGTMSDGTTPALICTNSTGFNQDGATAPQPSTGNHALYFVLEPTQLTDFQCLVTTGASVLVMQGGSTGRPGMYVGGEFDIVGGQASGLQILSFIHNDTSHTTTVYRNGASLGALSIATTYGMNVFPVNLMRYSNLVNGAEARIGACACVNLDTTGTNDLTIRQALKSAFPNLPAQT